LSSRSMSTEDDSVFFRIAEDIFEAEELEQLPEFDPPVENPITDQYTTAPLCLGREHLLEAFHEVLDWSMADRQADEWPELTAKFADAIIPSLDIRAGEELRIDRPQVFMDLNGPGVVFDGDNVVGTFLGLTPGKLFFVDEQHGSEEEAVLAETGE